MAGVAGATGGGVGGTRPGGGVGGVDGDGTSGDIGLGSGDGEGIGSMVATPTGGSFEYRSPCTWPARRKASCTTGKSPLGPRSRPEG